VVDDITVCTVGAKSLERLKSLEQSGKITHEAQKGFSLWWEEDPGGTVQVDLDDRYCFDDPLSGQTTMHAFSDLIHSLSAIHNEVARRRALHVSKTLRETSASLFRLQQGNKGEASHIRRQKMHEEIVRLQQTLKTDIEAKETASRMRICNFYKTGEGKMRPETFYCIKNNKCSREINTIMHEGVLVSDPDQIVATMQAWYERTAKRSLPQTETLTSFLARHRTDLPSLRKIRKRHLRKSLLLMKFNRLLVRPMRLVPLGLQDKQLHFINFFSSSYQTQ
jgi:hypothetical protein